MILIFMLETWGDLRSQANLSSLRIFEIVVNVAEVSLRSKHCSKTVVVPCSDRITLGQIGTTGTSGNPLRNIVE
jgi:hypothetical protein